MVVGKPTRYDMLKCRLASAAQHSISFSVIFAAFIMLYMGIPAIRRLWSLHSALKWRRKLMQFGKVALFASKAIKSMQGGVYFFLKKSRKGEYGVKKKLHKTLIF